MNNNVKNNYIVDVFLKLYENISTFIALQNMSK
jgi:hypothetical protein